MMMSYVKFPLSSSLITLIALTKKNPAQQQQGLFFFIICLQ